MFFFLLFLYGLHTGLQINLGSRSLVAKVKSQQELVGITLIHFHLFDVISHTDQVTHFLFRTLCLQKYAETFFYDGLSALLIRQDIFRGIHNVFRNLFQCIHCLICMDIRHLRLREKADKNLVETACACSHRRNVKMLWFLMYIFRCHFSCSSPVFDHLQELIQIRDNVAGITIHRITVSDLLHFIRNKVFYLQHMLHQFHMGHIVWMGFSQVKKDIFQFMGHCRDIVEHHDTGGTFYGMHGSEYFVDTVLVKAVCILLFQYSLLQLLQQLTVLEQIHIQHTVCVKIFSHIFLLSSFLRSNSVSSLPVQTAPDQWVFRNIWYTPVQMPSLHSFPHSGLSS